MSTELSTIRTPEIIAGEVNHLTAQAQRLVLGHAIEIGRRLTEAKEMLPHGEWGNWLKTVHYSSSSANNLMRIFDAYGAAQMGLFGPEANCQTFGNLEYSKALALLAVPEEEREQFAKDVDAEHVSVRELKAAIRDRDEARNQAEQAKADADLAREAAEKREKELALSQELNSGLQKEKQLLTERIAELEAHPVDVAVQTVDASAEQIAAAEARGRAETEAEIGRLKAQLEAAEAKAREALREGRKEAQSKVDSLRAKLAEAEQKAARQAQNAAPADRTLTEINVLFRQMQTDAARIQVLLPQLDDVTRERVQAALRKVLGQVIE